MPNVSRQPARHWQTTTTLMTLSTFLPEEGPSWTAKRENRRSLNLPRSMTTAERQYLALITGIHWRLYIWVVPGCKFVTFTNARPGVCRTTVTVASPTRHRTVCTGNPHQRGRCFFMEGPVLMRKTFLVLLAVVMLASACGGDDGAEPSTTDPDVTTGIDATATVPTVDLPAVDDPVVLFPAFRPAYDPAGNHAVYLHGLAVWVLETDDGITPTDPDDLTSASRQASECYASHFVSVLPPQSLAGVTGELAVQGLLDGFPLDIVTAAERDRLYVLAASCLTAGWIADVASNAPQDFLGKDRDFGEYRHASLVAGFAECLETLTADANTIEWILEDTLFDSPAVEQLLGVALVTVCRDTFMTPILTEQYVLGGYERGTAECAASRVAELLATIPEVFEAAEQDPEAAAAVAAEMSAIMSGCDVTDTIFLQ